MKLEVAFDATGTRDELASMAERVQSRSIMSVLGRGLEEYEAEVFASRGFGAWPRNDEDTLDQKSGSRVLVDTGGLLRQLTRAKVAFAGDSVQVDAGDAFYARFLRDGDGAMPKRNPAPRPTSRHVRRWADQVIDYIVTGKTR